MKENTNPPDGRRITIEDTLRAQAAKPRLPRDEERAAITPYVIGTGTLKELARREQLPLTYPGKSPQVQGLTDQVEVLLASIRRRVRAWVETENIQQARKSLQEGIIDAEALKRLLEDTDHGRG